MMKSLNEIVLYCLSLDSRKLLSDCSKFRWSSSGYVIQGWLSYILYKFFECDQ